MSRFDRLVTAVTDHSKAAIAIMVLLTVVVGAGAPMVEQSSSLSQFQSDTTESQKLDYIQENFQTGDQNTTTVQIIMRGENVLAKEQLLDSLALQQSIRTNETVAPSLVNNSPTTGVANIVAITAIRQEQAADIEQRRQVLNETAAELRRALTALRQNPNASIEAAFTDVRASTAVELNDTDYATFEAAAQQLRNASSEQAVQQAYTLGTRGVLAEEYAALQERANALRNAETPPLAEQKNQLRSMNASAVESLVTTVLQNGNGGSGGGVLALMPTDYETGSASAEATMIVVTQTAQSDSEMGSASDRLVETQTAMQEIANSRSDGNTYMVFGPGIIAQEITQSMTDSVLIVGPLALIFVLLTLVIAYRDLLDIALGLTGIVAVLVWTFGFMGWADIAFNQIFIAVPVLLIGLSIDYAIHIFMRHREEREAVGEGPRGSMRVALAGVGVALVWVTATTVIGFLSNLVSPLPPIQDFGIVSSVGITAALLVFGVLIPALKVELDEFLESRGFDRKKRAFGTGGGRLGKALTVGSTAAKKSPWLVILFAVLLSAGGAYGATQVDTSFSQTDFIAEDPPAWMEDLPEPFKPHDYTAKENLQYVNENFLRQDSQAQILIQGAVASDTALERLHDAQQAAEQKNVTVELSGGEAAITSPLTVMEQVAAQNETFNQTYTAADTDGNGVPDRNVEAVYDALFAVAPDQANGVIHRTSPDDYQALRMVVSVQGGASGEAVTEQMRAVAAVIEGGGLTATATGQSILFKIVQDQLLETVIESLLVTLVAIVVFLMAAYRLTEGSATLGLVTLLPVVFSVAWILGTMYLAGIPFNVLTGMITSLTVGLGVAYSIHLSERYNQELERRGNAFDALTVALKGTGGALLGSAATTVGGFGVLVFAVLPPLQQFGIITGMTIIYAFLAAVLVLPSLLVVWTRYTNPLGGDEFENGDDAETAVDIGEGADAPTREASPRFVQPGGEATVVVHLPDVAGRALLREDAPVSSLDHVDPEPLNTTVTDGTLYAVWETAEPTPARVEYTVSVPGDAQDNETVRFAGELRTPRGATSVEGDGFVTVVSDVFERIVSEGEVSRQDLALAAQQLEAGALSPEQYERIHEQWLNQNQDE
ncbi:MMPL family transporter [Salarchaeum sp. JOR-1]|uniref:MMPL family transporter n=1 Tax=Salarchaeum sp. JOR-1 TaxID=2599399 RepID=UPI00119873A0|nr:MMPL family transporter [Salarchaeum sp. JOR-1]QDX41207.1 MMPL family transporter [Salarchaeum sp. JOR-1]